jgi:hypothetical protein
MRHIHVQQSVREAVYMGYNFVTIEHKRQFFTERLRYAPSAETKKKFRKFKDDREIQTVVTRCLLIEDIDFLQQGIETVNTLFNVSPCIFQSNN